MKIKEGFVLREIAGTIVAVPTGELVNEFQGMINLTSSAKFVWELLQNDITIEEVSDKLSKKYEIDIQKAKQDVEKFVNYLRTSNLIEE